MSWSLKPAALIACATLVAIGSTWLWQQSSKSERSLRGAVNECRSRAGKGDAASEFKLGFLFYEGKGVPQDYAEARRWYQKAADQNYAKAQFNLGSMYYDGKGISKDRAEAVRWYLKAANQGDVRAQAALGYAYYQGEGVVQDFPEALNWYQKAADQGDPMSEQALGYIYSNGKGVPQDDVRAVAWYRRAADQGDATAEVSLGYMYANGRGVLVDRVEAVRWYRKAAKLGDSNARRALESMGTKPPPKTQLIERGTAALALIAGIALLPFSLLRKRSFNWRSGSAAVLSLIFWATAGLCFYASSHDVRYSLHYETFHWTRRFLIGMAILITVLTILPGNRSKSTVQ